MKKHTVKVIKTIARIRAKNNLLWMALLALAVDSKPRKARAILKQIQQNDRDVTKWTGLL